jgi:hypothetical protein
MNALEIIEQVRAHDAELAVENDRLVVLGQGEGLPADLMAALQEQKAAVMVALGASFDTAVSSILAEIRPYLPPALKVTSDANLLALVNSSILHAWGRAIAEIPRRERN